MEIFSTEPGENLGQSKNNKPFPGAILRHCAPIVREQAETHQYGGKQVTKRLYTLCHSSVKKVLIQNRNVLEPDGRRVVDASLEISPRVFALSCFKYLLQPRYSELLRMVRKSEGVTFETACGSDIREHHLLTYAARFWSYHMEDLPYDADMGARIEGFLRSSHFFTTVQVQCLFFGGKRRDLSALNGSLY
jgi:hypothetical protein